MATVRSAGRQGLEHPSGEGETALLELAIQTQPLP